MVELLKKKPNAGDKKKALPTNEVIQNTVDGMEGLRIMHEEGYIPYISGVSFVALQWQNSITIFI